MKRSRASLKNCIESSDSEDEESPSKKLSYSPKRNSNTGECSSSESDIENYLHKPEKLDLNSPFFASKDVSDFEQIENNMFSGVTRLSDSESENEQLLNESQQDVKGALSSSNTAYKPFDSFQTYTKKIEEAKRFVENYNAKNQIADNQADVFNLLTVGEGILAKGQNLTPADLHSSDFESCDSEQEDWEEIHNRSNVTKNKSLVPSEGLEIVVNMPDNVKKKKGIDLLAALKRRLNRIRKENQLLVHKVHLLCWIAHGNYISSIINCSEVLASALSLMPSEQSFPSGRIDLKYLEQIVAWYKKTIRNIEKPVPENVELEQSLQDQMKKKEAYNKKMLALIFVAILRSFGVQSRFVLSLQVEPLRPPASELHYEGTKNKESQKSGSSKGKDVKNSPSLKSIVKPGPSGVKITVQKPTPQKHALPRNKTAQKKSLLHENGTSSEDFKKKDQSSSVGQGIVKEKRRCKSAESVSASVSADKEIKKAGTKKLDKVVAKDDSVHQNKKKTTAPKKGLLRENGTSPEDSEKKDQNSSVGLSIVKQKRRCKSTESISADKETKKEGNKKHVKVVQGNNKRHVKSAENLDSKQTSKSPKRSARHSKKSDENVDNTASEKLSQLVGGKNKKSLNTTSTASKQKSEKLEVTQIKVQANNVNSVQDVSPSNNAKSVETKRKTRRSVKNSKSIPQTDGIFDSSESEASDSEVISQLDGVNDKLSAKPNLKILKNNKNTPVKCVNKCSKRKAKQPNLQALKVNKSDSDSEFEPTSGVSVKKRLEEASKDFKKLQDAKSKGKPKGDVTNDIVKLVKGKILEQTRVGTSRLPNKRKSNAVPDSDDDSDYMPEPIKKKHHDIEDDIVPKTKVKRRVQVKPELQGDGDKKKKKQGIDAWVEVFLDDEEKWISVDVAFGQVHCVKEIVQRASHPITYVIAWDNNNSLKDVTQRYCPNFNTVTRKLRVDSKWWEESLKPFKALPTARDRDEDEDLARQQMDQPLPKVISEYKNHPLYALRRHLLKFEAIYPPEPPTLGFVRGEAVYPRGCVFTLHSRDIWLKQAKVVKLGEEPYKIVKARPRWDKLSNQIITDQLLEIFGPWQVEDYVPPTAENGVVPRNAFGNVDLFKSCMLPKGCVHLKLPGLNKVAKRLNIDCASAITGFDFHGGWSHPVYDGFVVCEEFKEKLVQAWEEEQDELDRKEQEKIDKRVYGNWKRLIRGLLIRERLKAKYNFSQPTSS